MMRAFYLCALTALLSACNYNAYCVLCDDNSVSLDASIPDMRVRDSSDEDFHLVFPDATMGNIDGCVFAGPEVCNNVDDDCDGFTDEDFNLNQDPSNCGACGRICDFPGANVTCVSGDCVTDGCQPGYADLDDNRSCEYRCPVFPTQAEECNGFDDDCDGDVDEVLELPAPPMGRCRNTPGTLCAGVSMVCDTREGVTRWYCAYPSGVEFDPSIPDGILPEETKCDGVDGDCDGVADESFADLGTACDNGARGACRDEGVIACDPADATRTACDYSFAPDPIAGAPMAETCNNIDDNCDGTVDNSNPTDAQRVRDDLVHITHDSMDFWIYRYEAAHPDATASDQGLASHRSCSLPGVRPWTIVSFEDAKEACESAGFRMCTAAEWTAACAGSVDRTYPYGNTYQTATCNGADRDAVSGGDIDNQIAATGALAMCESPDGVFDMSGNVKEWTLDARGTSESGADIYVTRGGSYESPRLGLTCETDLSRATETTLLPTLGFRCCSDHAP